MIDVAPLDYLDSVHSRFPEGRLIVDVGAAEGELTSHFRARWPQCPVLAVEPTPVHACALRNRFRDDSAVTICELALGDHPQRTLLQCYADGTQNSLSCHLGVDAATTVTVHVSTLDIALGQHPHLPPPWFIKIDTQGFDLRVLRGGESTIATHRPLLQVEVLFSDLYRYQCSPTDVMAYLTGQGYHLADIRMPHFDAAGRLCYADWLFTPFPPQQPSAPFFCRDPFLLADRVTMFQQAAEERLKLIGVLDAECQARLKIIDDLRTARITDA
jgi:FkbM family methyltransferase